MFTLEAAVTENLTVLVADDETAIRRVVREALEGRGFIVVAEAADAASAIVLADRLQPSICLIEVELPGGGINTIGRITKSSPETLVVVFSRSELPQDVVDAFAHGASGYLLKGISGDRLATTLRAAYQGEPAVSRSLVPHLVDEIRRGSARRLSLPAGAVTLTTREWEVGELLRDGHSTSEIAARLGLSPVTVRRHIGLLLHKLHAESREDAIRMLRSRRLR